MIPVAQTEESDQTDKEYSMKDTQRPTRSKEHDFRQL